jgi:hypothetical protein
MCSRSIARRSIRCLLLVLGLAGCGKPTVLTVPVQGRITYGGGDWPKPGMLYFAPIEPAANFPQRPGRASFSPDGNFRAMTFKEGDGLIPGKYRINIECWETPPSMDAGAPAAKSYVPAKFPSEKSNDLEIDVPANRHEVIELKLDVPKLST